MCVCVCEREKERDREREREGGRASNLAETYFLLSAQTDTTGSGRFRY